MFGLKDGFDVVIGNPPYIGHKGGIKALFQQLKTTPLGRKFNNERMDIFYYFFHVAFSMSSSKGVVAFITTNYYLTADSAVKLRKDINDRCRLYLILNFNELKVFESAMGQHSMVSIITRNKNHQMCTVINVSSSGLATAEQLDNILNYKDKQTLYYTQESTSLFEGANFYIRLKYIESDLSSLSQSLLIKIRNEHKLLGEYCNISQGIVTGIDKVSPKHVRKFPEFEKYRNQGVFVINKAEKVSIGKSSLLKPWFKNSDIKRYYIDTEPRQWLIHTSVEIKLSEYPNIESHLTKFKKLILDRNYDSGELSKARRLNRWWALSSSRWEFDFTTPKIVSPQRSYVNAFAYSEKSWYASADVYFITCHEKIFLKYLLGLLNSKLIFFWLYHKGKRKGEMLELYLTPLSEIPVLKPSESYLSYFEKVVNSILLLKSQNKDISFFERLTNAMVYELYLPEAIQNAKCEVLKHLNNLPKLKEGKDEENLKTIEKVYKELSDPKHPVSAALLKLLNVEEVNIIEGRT
jgi:adenine-specific DNA-methyltransferase